MLIVMKKPRISYISLATVILLTAVVGVYIVKQSHASTLPSGSTVSFVHPGVLVNQADLDYVKTQLAAGAQPWSAALAKVKSSSYASSSYSPSPVANVDCGPSNNPDIGCTTEDQDAHAAYTQALLWYYTGQSSYAQKAIEILNAWSGTLTQHTGSNAPLVSAWEGEMFTRAAEIIRYSSAGWSSASIAQFSALLRNVYLPEYDSSTAVQAYESSNGNWDMSMANAKVAMGIFLDDHAVFNQGIAEWRARVPAYIYQSTDGGLPVRPPGTYYTTNDKLVCHWLNRDSSCPSSQLATSFVNGQSQETCRDTVHVALGFASMVNAAESAHNQGVDLYSEQSERIASGFEYNSHVVNTVHSSSGYPPGFCTNSAALLTPNTMPMYEIAYNEFAGRLNLAMPETSQIIQRLRAGGGSGTDHEMAWETLTHAGTFAAETKTPTPSVTPSITPTPTLPPTPLPTLSVTPTPTAKTADMTGDGHINVFDLSYLLSKWGTNDSKADLNSSGTVDIFDLSNLLSHWTG
jgi:hypothetical protein